MCQCLQIVTKDNQFDIIFAIKSGFVEENERCGPIIGYTYSKSRSSINKDGQELFHFFQSNGCWEYREEPDTIYRYRLHVDVKRAWKKFFSTGSGIDFVFSSKKNAKRSLKKFKDTLVPDTF